jgi:hypothetical protein
MSFSLVSFANLLLALQVFIKSLSPRTPRQPRLAEEKKNLQLEFLQ